MTRLKMESFCVPCAGQPAAALLECVQARVEVRGASPVASPHFPQKGARCSEYQCASRIIIGQLATPEAAYHTIVLMEVLWNVAAAL